MNLDSHCKTQSLSFKITLKRKAAGAWQSWSGFPWQVRRKPPIDKTEWDSFLDEDGQLAKSRDFICMNILERVRSPSYPRPCPGAGRREWARGRRGIGRACGEPMASHTPPLPQGLHPSVRTEAWKFLTGYYSWQSSQDERLAVDSTRR